MKISHEDYDQLTVMTLKGDLAGEESDRFRRAALERIDQHIRDFVLDMQTLDFVDSKGLESLIWLQDQCAERLGQVRLAACLPHVEQIFELTRLAGRLDCHGDVDAAIRSLR